MKPFRVPRIITIKISVVIVIVKWVHKWHIMSVVCKLHELNTSIERKICSKKQVIEDIKKIEQPVVITSINRKRSALGIDSNGVPLFKVV